MLRWFWGIFLVSFARSVPDTLSLHNIKDVVSAFDTVVGVTVVLVSVHHQVRFGCCFQLIAGVSGWI
jgi:hypothetical protein